MVEYLSGERVQASSALPITVGTEFNLRFDFEVDSYPAGTGASGYYGLFSKDNTSGADSVAQDFVTLVNNDGIKHKLWVGKNVKPYGGSGIGGSNWIDLVVGTQYYVEIVGNGDDTYTLSMREDSHSGSHVTNSPQTVDASSLDSLADLNYFGFKNHECCGNGGTVTLTDNLALYNGTDSASGTATFTDDFANDSGWTFTTSAVEISGGKLDVTMNRAVNDSATEKFTTNEIDDLTNVPTGTRLENTSTRKIYRRNDPIWIERGEATPSLKVWLDADDSSTITKDGSNKVSQWNDKSGEANHVSNSTAGSQPLWVDSAQNSKPLIRFDGSDDFLKRTAFTGGAITQPATVFAVVKMPSDFYKYAMDGATSAGRMTVASGNSSAITFVMYAGAELETLNHYTNMRQYTLTFNGASSVARQSSSAYMSGNAGTESPTGLVLADDWDGSNNGECDWCELLIYEGTVADSVRDSIESYLQIKWGL